MNADRLYPKLDRLVRGRTLRVVGGDTSVREVAEPKDLVVRFNNDKQPADLWATTFWDDREPMIPHPVELVLATVPNAVVRLWHPVEGMRQCDFRTHFARYEQPYPVEEVDRVHWLQLAAAMPILPLSGLVVLAMLHRTSFARCYIHGFDFYANRPDAAFLADSPLRSSPHFPYFGYHEYLSALGFLERLISVDGRFLWAAELTLTEIREIWRRRLQRILWRQRAKAAFERPLARMCRALPGIRKR